uniref:Uncharacterized protein n=1 Tax=Meloidogyne hapla TaxID=6305 RepID=A0A1I8B7G7_MELHA
MTGINFSISSSSCSGSCGGGGPSSTQDVDVQHGWMVLVGGTGGGGVIWHQHGPVLRHWNGFNNGLPTWHA